LNYAFGDFNQGLEITATSFFAIIIWCNWNASGPTQGGPDNSLSGCEAQEAGNNRKWTIENRQTWKNENEKEMYR